MQKPPATYHTRSPAKPNSEEPLLRLAAVQLLLQGLIEAREDPDGVIRLYPVKGAYKQVLRTKPGRRLGADPLQGIQQGGDAPRP